MLCRNMNLSSVDYLNCNGPDFLEPYDPRCREWYMNAMKNPGNLRVVNVKSVTFNCVKRE